MQRSRKIFASGSRASCATMLLLASAFLLLGNVVLHGQTFTKITASALVQDSAPSFGAAWFDADNDGDLDLFVANNGQNNALFLNENNGANFTKVTTGDLVTAGGNSFSISLGDYDNDGFADLFFGNFDQNNFLYHNNGNGSFTRVTAGAIAQDRANTYGSSWVDFDNDGDLDMFVANGGTQNDALYRNSGNGAFEKIASGVLVGDGVGSHGCSWSDFDNDGDADLFVATNYQGPNLFYRNEGSGNFSRLTAGDVVTDIGTSIGASWGDYDNDGDMDLFVANSLGQNNFLYRNDGGAFTKILDGPIVTDGGNSTGSSWVDFDNDGDLDLFVPNSGNQKNALYQNDGGAFTKITQGEIVNDAKASRFGAWGDYDNDGDLDLYVTNGFGADDRNDLYRNEGNANKWIKIKLAGVTSNKSALGAKVRLKATIGGKSFWQMRELMQQSGAYGEQSLELHLGLGDAAIADSLKIEWPSGVAQITINLMPGSYQIIEEQTPTGIKENSRFEPKGFGLLQNYPNPFNPSTNIAYMLASAAHVRLTVHDLLGRQIAVLVDDWQTAGAKSIAWNGYDDAQSPVASGIYFYKLETGKHEQARAMTLLR